MMRQVAVCLLSCLGGITAQDHPFRVQTNVVQVPVVVTEKNGRNVDGLAARDFKVLDNGVSQPVSVDDFSSGLAPISLVIAVQTSGISLPALVGIRRIGGMIQPLITGLRGEAAVVAFDSRIKWLQDFTPDDGEIRDAVKNLDAGPAMDQARMLDVIAEAAERMQERKGRKVLLVISESRDRGSETTFQQAMEAVERQGVEVFGAHYSAYATSLLTKPADFPVAYSPPTAVDPLDGPEPPSTIDFLAMIAEIGRLGKTNAVRALTRATGGSDYSFTREHGLENVIERVGVEVHSHYVLSFPQPGNAAGVHRIDVLLPRHSNLIIRARRTYWADGGDAH